MAQLKHVAIIGAGPAGLIAAEKIAAEGHAVTIYDRMPSPARKFLIAGRGGLNLTHSEPLESFLTRYGTAAEWLAPCIRSYPPEALRAWCESLGEETFVGSSGRVFPRTMKAVQLLRAWLQRLEKLGVQYQPRHDWQGWSGAALHFTNSRSEPVSVTPHATLLALGGASWPRLGSNGAWAPILTTNGIEVAPLRASNMGFAANWSETFRNRFAGQPLKQIALTHQNVTHRGEAMITANGIEGGAIYALSAAIRDAIEMRGSTTVAIDMRPAMSHDALTQKLQQPRASKSFSTYLGKLGFDPLAINLLREVTAADALAALNPGQLAARLKALPVTLTASAGIARAISSAGGITRAELTDDFMLKRKPGVFAAGEMLDWEAPTGGYLLQACFSTAVAAANGIREYLKD